MDRAAVIVFGDKYCGKSTVVGHILYHYAAKNEEELKKAKEESKKYDKQNSEFAFLCDESEKDRKDGTSDFHIFQFRTKNTNFTMIDSCSSSLNRLIEGLGQCCIGILILEPYEEKNKFDELINKKSDIYKYLLIAHSFGLQHIIICINNMDKNNIKFDEKLYFEYCESIKIMLISIGYNPLNIPIIPISGYNGDNLYKPSIAENLKWWKSFDIKSKSNDNKTHKISTLMHGLKYLTKKCKKSNIRQSNHALLCMTITSRLEMDNIGTILLSRVEMGELTINQTVLCCKSRQNLYVKKYKINSIQSDGKDINKATMGHIIGFTLKPKISEIDDKDQPQIGDIICSPNAFKLEIMERRHKDIDYVETIPSMIKFCSSFTALIIVLNEDICGQKITLWSTQKQYDHDLYFRTKRISANLGKILIRCKRKDDNLENPLEEYPNSYYSDKQITNGDQAEVVFHLKNPELISSYNLINTYSRFVMMKENKPIAIGKIIGMETTESIEELEWNGIVPFIFKTNLERCSVENDGKTVKYSNDINNDRRLCAVILGDIIKSDEEKRKIKLTLRIDSKADHVGFGFVTNDFNQFEVGPNDWHFLGKSTFFYSDRDYYGSNEFENRNNRRLTLEEGSMIIIQIDCNENPVIAKLWKQGEEDSFCETTLSKQFAVAVSLGGIVGTTVSLTDWQEPY